MKGFRKFVLRGNLVDLSVAVVIGVAFTALVNAFVADLVTPLITAVGGHTDFANLKFKINGSPFLYGDLLNKLFSFLISAIVVYFLIVLPVGKLLAVTQRNKEAAERDCPECLSQIPAKATRCKFCTAPLAPPPSQPVTTQFRRP